MENVSNDQGEASEESTKSSGASTESPVATLNEYDLDECRANSDDDHGDVADAEWFQTLEDAVPLSSFWGRNTAVW